MSDTKNNKKEIKEEGIFSNVWTIPNLLSFIRILLIPLFAYLFLKENLLWAVFVLALSGLSDFFDGKIARRFNQVSALGKLLDPVADKLTQATIAVLLFYRFFNANNHTLKLFAWVFLLFIVKELVMLIGGGLMIYFGIRPGAAEIYGKAATMAFYLVMITIMAFGPEVGAALYTAGFCNDGACCYCCYHDFCSFYQLYARNAPAGAGALLSGRKSKSKSRKRSKSSGKSRKMINGPYFIGKDN